MISRRGGTRRDPSRFADVGELWSDLLGRSARRPAFRLVRDGVTFDGASVTRTARVGDRDLDDLAAPNRIIDAYRDGATVVLQGLHLTNPSLAKLANNLALELDQPVQINAYLSPAATRGLDVHFDYHDVFVVQVEGTKRWRVWDRLERSVDPVVGTHRIPKPRYDELGDPTLDLTLGPGDVVYLPRGFPHAAESIDDVSSHLTIGVLAITWHRLVRRAVDAAVAGGRLTASIPLSSLEPDGGSRLERLRGADLDAIDDEFDFAAVQHWLAGQIWGRQAVTRLRPRQPIGAADIGDRRLAFTPGPLIWLTQHAGRSALGVGDRVITMPIEAHEFLTALLKAAATFDGYSIDGLDDDSRRVVLTRLVDEGVLQVVDGA